MPTYEYECTKCGHTFEAFQSIKDEPLSHCPKCKGKVRRLIGGGMGIIFKGSGFYTTDYKNSSALTGGNGSREKKEGAERPVEKAKDTSSDKPAAAGAEKKAAS